MTTEMSSLLQVAKARQLIQMESSQPITLDERLGKVPKPDGNFGNKNQFESWDFPKPSQQIEGNPGNLFRTGPEVVKLFSCSTQLSMEFQLLMKTKMLKNIGISCFQSLR